MILNHVGFRARVEPICFLNGKEPSPRKVGLGAKKQEDIGLGVRYNLN